MFKLLKEIGILTLLTVYLFINGTMFLYGYWATFKLDVAALISVADIPKSVFSVSVGLIEFVLFYFYLVAAFLLIRKSNGARNKTDIIAFIIIVVQIVLLVLSLIGIIKTGNRVILTFFGFVFLSIIIWQEFVHFHKRYPFVLYCIIGVLPIMAYVDGTIHSKHIYDNDYSFYVDKIVFNDTANIPNSINHSKLLGYLGDKIILSDSFNTKVIILQQNSIKYFALKPYIKKSFLKTF